MFELKRERRTVSEVTVEIAYGITDLSRPEAGAADLLKLNRGHWSVENGLHRRRDVTLREDSSRIRSGNAAQLMAILRNLIIYLLHQSGSPSLPSAMRHHLCHPQKSLELVSSRS